MDRRPKPRKLTTTAGQVFTHCRLYKGRRAFAHGKAVKEHTEISGMMPWVTRKGSHEPISSENQVSNYAALSEIGRQPQLEEALARHGNVSLPERWSRGRLSDTFMRSTLCLWFVPYFVTTKVVQVICVLRKSQSVRAMRC